MDHTPEPWNIFDAKKGFDFQPIAHIGETNDGRDLWIGQNHTQMHDGDADGDARRIKACVNACVSLSTEAIEMAGNFESPVERLRSRNIKLEHQRESLITALESVIEYACERFGPGGYRDGVRMPKDYQPDCIQEAMTIIEEIEG